MWSQVVELLQEVAEYIKTSEPTTTRYEITRGFNKETKGEEVIVIERLARGVVEGRIYVN